MFTGLVEETGKVRSLTHREDGLLDLAVECSTVLEGLQVGDSICVSGCCLTATGFDDVCFSATATPETLNLTNLGQLQVGSPVNLERSVTLQTRLGGHMVQGHVDGVGKVAAIKPEGESQRWEFEVSPALTRYMVHKGSVAINGVSLTIAELTDTSCSVALIPKTIELTTFRTMRVGDVVNIEVDLIGKYVYQFLQKMNGGRMES